GMSSSLMAKKTADFLVDKGNDIEIDAVSTNEGYKMIEKGNYDLFLVSPQTKMYYQKLKEAGDSGGKSVVNIPSQDYVTIHKGKDIVIDAYSTNEGYIMI